SSLSRSRTFEPAYPGSTIFIVATVEGEINFLLRKGKGFPEAKSLVTVRLYGPAENQPYLPGRPGVVPSAGKCPILPAACSPSCEARQSVRNTHGLLPDETAL